MIQVRIGIGVQTVELGTEWELLLVNIAAMNVNKEER